MEFTWEAFDRAMRRAWFPVARSVDVDRPIASELLGEELVVWRTEAGAACVSSIRCPHRGGDLSLGDVHGETLACPYHGWRFRGDDGRCTLIPSLGERAEIPSKATIRAYPVEERFGLIWSCVTEPFAPLYDPPEWHDLDLDWLIAPPLPHNSGPVATMENFRDWSHFPFVHRVSMGEMETEVGPIRPQSDALEVRATNTFVGGGGAADSIYSSHGAALTMHYHTFAPALATITYDDEKNGARVLLSAPRPLGRDGIVLYYGTANDAKTWTGPSNEDVLVSEIEIFTEDKPILDSLRPREVPLDGAFEEISTAADRYTLAYRKAVVEFVARAGAP